jgi:hypothetical protein
MPDQGDIHDQIVVSFDVKLAQPGVASAIETVNKAVHRLHNRGVPVLEKYVSEASDAEAFFAIILARLDSPTPTLEDLQVDSAFLNVCHVERNVPVALSTYNDPLLGQQWALAPGRLGAAAPWSVAPPGTAKTVVGIVDSGLFRAAGGVHADLGAVEPLKDCQPQPTYDANGNIDFPGLHLDGIDQDGHGTLLAGTIAAVPGNGVGVGSAVHPSWNISLLPVKFFSPAGRPDAFHAALAIAHAVGKGAKVINASWHVPTGDSDLWMLRLALEFARLKNRLVVISAGNDGSDNEVYPTFPANFGSAFTGNVITVAASDRDDFKASYSNYGPTTVDIAAPGTAILSTALYLAGAPRYADYSGTSAAAAFVSSAAALVFALNPPDWDGAGAPGWGARAVKQHLMASAETKPGLMLACIGGRRLSIARAVHGPLALTAPATGATLVVGVPTTVAWTVAYDNPRFTDVRVELVVAGNRFPLGTVPIGAGLLSWTPTVAQVGIGWIRITPTTGNFPVRSGLVAVVA